jgi:heptosyltransferase-2
MKKILIIKLGYSETLDSMLSLTTSLGDVLRTTFILHFFKNCHVTWLVDKKASPLLEGNKYISRIRTYDRDNLAKIRKEQFDIIINLEKLPEICALSDSLTAKERIGFKFNGLNNGAQGHNALSNRLLNLTQDVNKRRANKYCWQKIISELMSKQWDRQPYILGYKPKSKMKYDIGFNWTVGSKWKNKSWPKAHWDRLEDLIKNKYSITWQRGLNSIFKYIDWINSCKLIITSDSLGLHLGLALKKKVIALFGPTSHREIYFYKRGSYLLPIAPYRCVPCLKPYCDKKRQCMEFIAPERVKEKIEDEF